MGVSDCLAKIQELTNTNLKLLKALNDSFYVKQDHLSVDMGDEGTFVIPSFVSLENKLNTLQNNFENLVNAPITSEAHFIFDGDSRTIDVRRYEQSPSPLILDNQTQFYHENNDILKDFLTPVPFLKFDLQNLPNDITTAIIRKVSAISSVAKSRFATILSDSESATISINWGDVKKLLDDLKENEDYVLYDTTQKLPVRKGQGSGCYVVREIIDDSIDDNLDQHITVRFANDIEGCQNSLTYLLFDQTIEKRLVPGDYLTTWDGLAKFEVEELNFNTNVIKMRVCYGDYTNIYPFTDSVSNATQVDDVSKMRFFSNQNLFDDENYVKVTLEEDQYIFIAIAPLNDRMNIRAPWGTGVMVDTNKLVSEEGTDFRSYYQTCRNIGDILNEISKVMSNTTSSHTNDELNYFMSAKPVIDDDIIKVTHINKHLDDTPTIKNIRALYSQKNSYNASLTEAQNSLSILESTLSTIDFEDTTGIREQTQNQIDELTKRKNELINSLIKITDEIALVANNSVVPIEDPKYRIRGFFDFVEFVNQINPNLTYNITPDNIKGISVQYRYRNVQQETGTAQTFIKDVNGNGELDEGDKTFIFSDWNRLNTPLRLRIRKDNGDGTYSYVAEPDTSNMNVPSFNQIDIPITQGEIVDMRLKVIYDFGYPFIQMMSDWSDIVTFEFPVEFMKDVSVISIIEENNNDIETNRFNSILTDAGVIDHVNDKILDQDVTFFHKPENISSGFYTNERRVIPLRDKLKTMDDDITRISDEISGGTADQLQVSIDFDESSIIISPYEVGHIILKSYSSFNGLASGSVGNYEWSGSGSAVNLLCNIRLTNTSNHSLKIFPMFTGDDSQYIGPGLRNYKFDKNDFYQSVIDDDPDTGSANTGSSSAVWVSQLVNSGDTMKRDLKRQSTNQIITFRTRNPWDGSYYYASSESYATTGGYLPACSGSVILPSSGQAGMSAYPYLIKKDGLKMSYKETSKYMLLNNDDDIVIPIKVEYNFTGDSSSAYQKTMSFDVRTSLYNDPLTYTFVVEAPNENIIDNKLVSSLTKQFNNKDIKNRKYTSIVR